jgi:hypothetical protein
MPYPKTASEYHALMDQILDAQGCFPGDLAALTNIGTFSPCMHGARHFSLRRKGVMFQGELFTPRLHAAGVRNRFIFDADLVTQAASFHSYGTAGVSYARESYYERRLYASDRVCFFRTQGWPVSFTAMQGYQMTFKGKPLHYGFIQFCMTKGAYQRYGLSSYAIRRGLNSLFYPNIMHHRPALLYDSHRKLEESRFRMWAAIHSGRFVPFYMCTKLYGGIEPQWEPIAQAIFKDAHRRITLPEAFKGDPVSKGTPPFNKHCIPVAVDRAVYPPHNRYPTVQGRVVFPKNERALAPQLWETWLACMEGGSRLSEGQRPLFRRGINDQGLASSTNYSWV